MKRLIFAIIRYFGQLWFALFPVKYQPQSISIAKFRKELESRNKNELVKCLIELLADKERLIPTADKNWKKKVKETYSKTKLITAIINLYFLTKTPEGKKEEKKHAEAISE